jgi:hypothetical protein
MADSLHAAGRRHSRPKSRSLPGWSRIASIRRRRLRRLAWAGLEVFVAAVVVEHAAEPSFNPATHEISEYVHGSAGGVMLTGFLAWAVSLACTGVLAATTRRTRWLAIPLGVAAAGIVVTAAFGTQTSAGKLPPGVKLTLSGQLHDIGSGATTVALSLGALASIWALNDQAAYKRRTAALLAFVVFADVALLLVGSSVGGVRQRVLVTAGCLWQAMFLAQVQRVSRGRPC